MSLDVVIATYNRPEALRRSLGALAAQTMLPGRVIVVDDRSPAPVTRATLGDTGALHVDVLTMDLNGGPARARNAGVAESHADIVLFVDDDVVADSRLVERHAATHAGGGPLVVIGPLAAPGDWRPTPWNRWEAETLSVEYDRMVRGVYAPTWRQLFTGNTSMRREDFERAGGFDSRFTRAEDIELGIRLKQAGCQFAFEPAAIGWHYAYRTRRQWLRIPRDYAVADAAIAELHPRLRWREHLAEEAAGRHRLVRGLGAVLRPVRGEYAFAGAAARASVALARIGLGRMADGALSSAYGVSYQRAARDLRGHPNPWVGSAVNGPAQPIHPPSTPKEDAHGVSQEVALK